MNYDTDRTANEGCAAGVPAGNAARLPKLDDISEPVLDEAERVRKKWGEDSPSWRNAVRRFLSAPPAAATNVIMSGEALQGYWKHTYGSLDGPTRRRVGLPESRSKY